MLAWSAGAEEGSPELKTTATGPAGHPQCLASGVEPGEEERQKEMETMIGPLLDSTDCKTSWSTL